MKKFAFIALIPLLASCAGYSAIETPPVPVNFTTAIARDNVDTLQNLAVRTTVETTSAGKTTSAEISGVPCSITGTGFRVNVVSPAIVKMPRYRGKTDPAKITCTYQGKSLTETIHVINETKNAKGGYTTAGGLAGIVLQAAVVGVMKGVRDPSKDRFVYVAPAIVTFGKTDN